MSRRKTVAPVPPTEPAGEQPRFRLPPPVANRFQIGLSLALVVAWLAFLAYVAMG